ncbi:MAG: lipopolysaccharide transport periplasmic protein LptA [Deltaproteobacteria bacterium]|nr:lipopolysaccharide transport periplasmic protein LptA [Deltaproteobacteria bacterium]
MKRMFWWSIFFLSLTGFGPAGAAEPAAPGSVFLSKNKAPIDIVADQLDFDQKKREALFSGNVVARQAETELHAEKLKVLFAGEEQRLEEVVATGARVVIQLEGKKALCRRMHYFADERKIILSGEPSLDDGRNVIVGEEILFFLDEERSVVKSGAQKRVKTTIFPGRRGLLEEQ